MYSYLPGRLLMLRDNQDLVSPLAYVVKGKHNVQVMKLG